MVRLVAGCLIVLALSSPAARAQDWSIVMAALGAGETEVAQSARLLAAVQRQLEPHGIVRVRDTIRDLRLEVPVNAVFGRAVNLGATGAAVLQFHPEAPEAASGWAHLWVSRIGGIPEYRIEYVADITGDLDDRAWTFAAAIVATISRGAYRLVELHVFSRPMDVSVSVGEADPVRADRPGREPGEGFAVWRGLRPAGATEVRLSRPPDYWDRTVRVDVPVSGAGVVRLPLEVELTRAAPLD